MRKRNYNEIEFEEIDENNLVLKHLIGEMVVPSSGGGYILTTPCGGGKTTGIVSLARLCSKDGFVIFVKTKNECNELRQKLISKGVGMGEILVLHGDSMDYDKLIKNPESITQYRILILSNIHLYTDFIQALLAYDMGRMVNLDQFVGDIPKLMKSELVRRFVLIDENPEFIKPFATINGINLTNIFGNISIKQRRDGVAIASEKGCYLNPIPLVNMEEYYFARVRRVNSFWRDNTALNILRSKELLHYIRKNFKAIADKKSISIFQNVNDLIVAGSRCNLYIFDATGGVLSNFKGSNFKLITSNTKSYSSDIIFEKFHMPIDRWIHENRTSSSSLDTDLQSMADEIEREIRGIKGNLLIVTWQYMELKHTDPEIESNRVDLITALDAELQKRGVAERYSIIYRGSGDDKATNKFASYEAVTFLGEWKGGIEGVKRVNQNLGINSKEIDLRVAAMVQTICRTRIRLHNGDPIKIFYSSDIDPELMTKLSTHFSHNSESGVTVSGVPTFVPSSRDMNLISKVRSLCKFDPLLFSKIQRLSGYTLSISLNNLLTLIPMKERRSRAYKSLRQQLQTEYNINLEIV